MASHEVTFPITDPAEILKLRAGDEVTVQGHIIGIRDRTQVRIFDEGVPPPMDLKGAFLLHTAPNVRKLDNGRYEKICIGTTTSARMVKFTEPLGTQSRSRTRQDAAADPARCWHRCPARLHARFVRCVQDARAVRRAGPSRHGTERERA